MKFNERLIEIVLTDQDYEYMTGHTIDERLLIPATGYLVFVWETISLLKRQLYMEVPVVFENVKFLQATHFPKQGTLELTVMIQKGNRQYSICVLQYKL